MEEKSSKPGPNHSNRISTPTRLLKIAPPLPELPTQKKGGTSCEDRPFYTPGVTSGKLVA
jgi:hypothetical protein